MSLNKKLEQMLEAWEKYKHEEIEEANVTGNLDGGEGPPKTPYAFGKKEDEQYRHANSGRTKKRT